MKSVVLITAGLMALSACTADPIRKEQAFLRAGKSYLEKKDYPRAILNFRSAAKAVPNDGEAYYQLGLALLAAEDYAGAYSSFRRATELSPKHVDAQLKLSTLMLTSRSRDIALEAQEHLNQVLTLEPGNIDALRGLAASELRLGNSDDAEQRFEELLKKAPADLQSAVAVARIKFMRKDTAGAEQVLKSAAEQAPRSAEAAIAIAQFYTVTSRLPEAEKELQRALAIDPQNSTALIESAAVYVRSGKPELAERMYLKLSELQEYHSVHAMYLFAKGSRAEATAELEQLRKKYPDDRDVRSRLVAVYSTAGKLAEARKILDEAVEKNGKDTQALAQRSSLYLAAGKYTEAQEDLQRVIRLRPSAAEAHYGLAQIHKARGADLSQRQELGETLRLNPRYLPARLELAQLLLAQKDARSALDTMKQTPEDQQKNVPVIVQKNWALLAANQTAEAQKSVEEALKTSQSPDLLTQEAVLKIARKDITGARQTLQQALQQAPDNMRALELLAYTYETSKQTAAGTEALAKFVANYPKSPVMLQFWGQWLYRTGNHEKARKAFTDAIAADPTFGPAVVANANMDAAEGKFDNARKGLTAFLASKPPKQSLLPARILLAQVEEATGGKRKAMDLYREILNDDPQNSVALNNLAYALCDYEQKPDEALSYAEKAVQADPNNPAFEDTLGWVYYRKGVYVSAVRHLENAVTKEPAPRRQYHLAMAYFKAGDRKRGDETLKAALRGGPGLPEAAMARDVAAETAK